MRPQGGRRTCALACAVLLGVLAGSANAAELSSNVWCHDGATGRSRIAGAWSFALDPTDVGTRLGWATRIPPGAATVHIPHVWNADLSPEGFQGTVGWYWARFRVARAGTYRVHFLSTHHLAIAFLDGRRIGSHEGGFLAWDSEAVRLRAGMDLLALRAA